ncbi:spore coat protein B [Paenibacillus castaneae]|uniref:hypothetical protein n=1 Tax=Paenibacillus castaneae TaxID=474957 RepID=UPI00141BE3B2|nr:hypothetical protein [Paenibacillus castaneae]NIK76122.1 spore coat protein B [Paenibacillus castaneae]
MSYLFDDRYYAAQNANYNHYSRSNNENKSNNSQNDQSYLRSLVGKFVKINRGGPDMLQGKLLAVKSDYLVLSTMEGIIYIATSHVKSITEIGGNNSNKSGNNNKSSSNNKSGNNKSSNSLGSRRDQNYINASDFDGVIRALNQKFVKLNSGGPEKVEGFIAEVRRNSILLVSGNEAIQIQIFHIKTIKEVNRNQSGGNKNKNSNSNNNNSNNNNKSNSNNNSNNNKSGNKNKNNNKTNGNRSGGNRSNSRKRAEASAFSSVIPTRRSVTKG